MLVDHDAHTVDATLELRRVPHWDSVTIELSGEIDVSNAEAARRQIHAWTASARPNVVTLDLTDLSFCDSSGLRALLDVRSDCAPFASRVVLRDAQPAVQRVLDLTGIGEMFTAESSEPEQTSHASTAHVPPVSRSRDHRSVRSSRP